MYLLVYLIILYIIIRISYIIYIKNEKLHYNDYLIDGDEIYEKTGIGENSRFNYKTKEAKHGYNLVIIDNIFSMKSKKNKKILILGVALGGMIVHLLDKDKNIQITGVDIIDNNFSLVQKYSDQSRLTLVKEDANKYIFDTTDKYDVIVCDIFEIDQMPDFIFKQTFMKQLNTLLLPNGKFILNSIGKDRNFIINLIDISFDKHTIEYINNHKNVNDIFIVNKI